ncbi:hypothetical protein KI387_010349, partial [Taxus chinensis]
MLGKRSRPVQRTPSKLFLMPSENLETFSSFEQIQRNFSTVRGCLSASIPSQRGFPDGGELSGGIRSPTSPLDHSSLYHKSPRGFDQGVGLGILAALHNAETKTAVLSPKNSEAMNPAKQSGKPSQPIAIGSAKPLSERWEGEQSAMEYSESYTCITSHGPKTTIRHIFDDPAESEKRNSKCCKPAVFETSSFCDADSPYLPDADFLSACYLCRRQLRHGKDIYMYRGDKAFCSVECRYQQIVSDEKER